MTPARAAALIHALQLAPHPEGGFYREIFRSGAAVAPEDARGPRAALTTIYYLLPRGAISRWHRVASDEVWHLYEGGPLELLELAEPAGPLVRRRLAPVGADGDGPVHTVRAGVWQAARPLGDYALAGCTVGPGFDFADFAFLAADPVAAAAVRAAWPDAAALV